MKDFESPGDKTDKIIRRIAASILVVISVALIVFFLYEVHAVLGNKC